METNQSIFGDPEPEEPEKSPKDLVREKLDDMRNHFKKKLGWEFKDNRQQ